MLRLKARDLLPSDPDHPMKRLVFLIQTPMGASVEPQESLDAVLAGSAFTDCTVIFVGLGGRSYGVRSAQIFVKTSIAVLGR